MEMRRILERGGAMAEALLERLGEITASYEEPFVLLTRRAAAAKVNPAAEALIGYSESEMRGNDLSLLFDAAGVSRLQAGFEQLRNGGGPQRLVSYVRAKSGSRFRSALTLSPVRDHEGKLVGASLAIRRSSHRTSAGVDGARFSAMVASPSGVTRQRSTRAVFVAWNAAAEHLFGYADYETIGSRVSILVPRDQRPRFRREMGRVLAGSQVENCSCLRVNKAGELVETSFSLTPIIAKGNRIVGLTAVSLAPERAGAPGHDGENVRRRVTRKPSATAPGGETVTQRRRALAKNEFQATNSNWTDSHWRKAFDQSPIATAIISTERAPIWVNDAYVRLLGCSRKKLLRLKWLAEVTHPEDLSLDDELFGELLAGTRESFEHEKRYLHADGHVVPVRVFVTGIYDESGALVSFLAQAIDLTTEWKAQEERRHATRFAHVLFEQSAVAAGAIDPDGTIVTANDSLVGLSGYSREQLIGSPFTNFVDPDDVHDLTQRFAEFYEGIHDVDDFEIRLLHSTGRSVPTRMYPSALRDDSEALVGFVGQIIDLTEQKQAEEQRETEARLRRILFDESPISAAATDVQGRFIFLNDATVRLFGYSREELIGSSFLSYVHPDDTARHQKGLSEFLAGTQDSSTREIRLRHADGHFVPCEIHTVAMRDDSGSFAGVIGQLIDLTEQKRAEEERARATRLAHLLFEQSPIPTGMVDLVGRLQLVNDAFAEVLGSSSDKLVGTMVPEMLYPEEAADFRRLLPKLLSGGRELLSVERHLRHADGHFVPGRLYITAVRDNFDSVVGILGQFLDRSDLARLEEQLVYEELHDSLTSLPTRTLVADRIGQEVVWARARHRSVGVIIVNVDRFDAVNENFGRALGDRLLVELGQRLVECSLRTDTIGRLEGDKFIVVRGAASDPSEMVSYADEIRAALEQPFLLDGEAEVVTVSIGIAISSQDESPERLISDAQLAVAHAKEKGGDSAFLFSENLREVALARASVETGLRRALAEGEFVLYYQPIIDLRRGRFIGTEALIRWMDPTRGIVLPDDFISIAEETGLIVPIGEWVAGEACRQTSAWNRERPDEPWEIAVNVSPRQVQSGSLLRIVTEALDSSGLDPKVLTLELTESTFMANLELVHEALDPLRELGVRIAIDDFGTGYSSLGRIRRFGADILKIDRSFVSGLEDNVEEQRLATTILDMGRALNATVIAEGVETPGQLAWLKSAGCRCAQGYFFARPQTAADCFALLTRD
jgi:PAS domain S-box-containing protein/diguanylate cyclase (GGDEF)-like protein